jgi:hypothetical protein
MIPGRWYRAPALPIGEGAEAISVSVALQRGNPAQKIGGQPGIINSALLLMIFLIGRVVLLAMILQHRVVQSRLNRRWWRQCWSGGSADQRTPRAQQALAVVATK